MTTGLKENKPIMLEIYADWCLPCKAMERRVFNDPEIVSISKNILCIRLDLTRKQPFQEEIMKSYQAWGVPTIIFIDKKGKEEKGLRIESYIDNADLLNRMKSLLQPKV
jgi:thiol:disulfide interchange protein DsbD